MVELPDPWVPLIAALLRGPRAWQSPAALAAATGAGEDATSDLLCELDLAGWLDTWDTDDGPAVTLSALGAARLGARVVEVGRDETPRWALPGDPEPPSIRARNVCASARAALLDYLIDPSPGPLSIALGTERIEIAATQRAAAKPKSRQAVDVRPTVLIGIGLSPWPGPAIGGVCPACRNSPLGPSMYCLCCDRWGLDRPGPDGEGGPAPTSPPARNRTLAIRPASESAQIERDRARRKSKRRERHEQRVEAERSRKAQAKGSGWRAPARAEGQNHRPGTGFPASPVFAHPPASGKSSASASR